MKKYLLITAVLACMALPSQALSAVTGQCAGCHTMHNSQNGIAVNDPAGPENGGTHPTLLKDGCVGCHSNDTPTYDLGGCTVPVVNHTGTSVPTEYLAGGNFYWVANGDDAKGHNVLGVANQDLALTTALGAPGGVVGCANSCHETLAAEPAGSMGLSGGCQGCHLAPAHHADDSGPVVGETGGYYRFLSGHMGGNGVTGIEDADWQLTVSATDHNEYLGDVTADLTGTGSLSSMTNTMSGYCCGCHGNFHIENTAANGSGAWIRHPSDVVIPSTGEYAAYTVYDPLAPVARPSLDTWTVSSATVTPGTDLVMCLSCHRPHGSPYDDLLRWDYSEMNAGTTGVGQGVGCFACHTNKDG